MTVNRDKAQRAVADLLEAFGRSPTNEPDFAQTPALVVESWEKDWLSGYDIDVASLFATATPNAQGTAPVVSLSKIAICTLCPHHLLPAEGLATVAYLPGRLLMGLGTLARIVNAYSRRFTLQERIGINVVDALMTHGAALGAYCRLDMQHACLRLRGPKQGASWVTTTQYAGVFDTVEGRQQLDTALRPELPT